MPSLTCLGHGGGINHVSKHLGLGATHLKGISASSKIGCLFQLGMVSQTSHLTWLFPLFHSCSKSSTFSGVFSTCKKGTGSSLCDKK